MLFPFKHIRMRITLTMFIYLLDHILSDYGTRIVVLVLVLVLVGDMGDMKINVDDGGVVQGWLLENDR